MQQLRNQRGVTLMELLTVVAIVGLLGVIAVPGYRQYMMRSGRADGKAALLQVQTAQERFYLDNNAYTANVVGAPPAGLGLSGTSASGKYTVAVALGAGGQTYTVTATPVAGHGQDGDAKCTTLTITDTGQKGSTGSAAVAECWK